MDNLFKTRVLTTAVNKMTTPSLNVFNRYFAGKAKMQTTSRLAFDIITGNEGILPNIATFEQATVTEKTGRKVVTMEAPRLAHKRLITAADLEDYRKVGDAFAPEMLAERIAREQTDMRGMIDRTIEAWACMALRGIIYDKDLTTELVNYSLSGTHSVTKSGADAWTASTSTPRDDLRTWMRLIEDESRTTITGWRAYVGKSVMDALVEHADVKDFIVNQAGLQVLEAGRITKAFGWTLEEYYGSWINDAGTRVRFVADNEILLIGECADLTDCPFAPIVDLNAPGGIGNVTTANKTAMYFSKIWDVPDPSGKWLMVETRPLPVLQRPDAVIIATVTA